MKVRTTALALALLGTACAHAPAQKPPAEASVDPAAQLLAQTCAQKGTQCLETAIPVSLLRADGSTYQDVITPPTPIIQYDSVSLYAGQTLYIEADVDQQGGLMNLRAVSANTHPAATLVLTLKQTALDNGKRVMTLEVTNPFDRILRYHGNLMPLDSDETVKTVTCPAVPKLPNTQTFPNPVFMLQLTGFRLLAPEDPAGIYCAE